MYIIDTNFMFTLYLTLYKVPVYKEPSLYSSCVYICSIAQSLVFTFIV